MADYKRMVSYMYQYENGVKKKNMGYARVEAKNGQCKITLHMQLLGQLDSIFPTYLIQRDENNMELIYLGDTILKNQVIDSKLTANEANIMDSGYSLDAMGGMLLFLNDNVFFATEWDDKPIIAKEVLEAMKPKRKKTSVPNIEQSTKGLAETESVLQEQPVSEIDLLFKEELSLAEELLIPKYKLPRGWKTVERIQKPYPLKADNQAENSVEAAAVEMAEQPFIGAASCVEVPCIQEGDQIWCEANLDTTEDSCNVEAADTNQEVNGIPSDLPDHPTATHFFSNYPRIYPFEDNEISLCVKIEPKDIGLLPKDTWVLSSNSFLMHGFYCYHHLIFAKMKDRIGCSYLLGVPGIYHNRERFMARMFGFESFKSIRKREPRQGDFGYWYLPITLDINNYS